MASPTPTEDLLDLKMLPAWASEPAGQHNYADFAGEDADARPRLPDGRQNRDRGDRDRRVPRPARDRNERSPQRDDRSRRPRRRENRPDRPTDRRRDPDGQVIEP